MIVEALVRDVTHTDNRNFAIVTLEFAYPAEIKELRIFDPLKKNAGSFAFLKDNVGTYVRLPIEANVYRDKAQLNFPFVLPDFISDLQLSKKKASLTAAK